MTRYYDKNKLPKEPINVIFNSNGYGKAHKELSDYINDLLKENTRLKNCINDSNENEKILKAESDKLQQRMDKAIELLEQENSYCPSSLTLEKSYIIEVEKINKVLSILKGSEEK